MAGQDEIVFAGEALACRRGGRSVFAGLAFGLRAGEALVLRGANGSGKTSLLRLMAGLLPPAAGRMLWRGGDIAEDPEAHARRLRLVGHLDAVKPGLTVAENLRFWAQVWGGAADCGPALEAFGLGALADLPARMLSAGQRHRLSLARLLAAPAQLWLLDEPTNALDDAAQGALAQIIARHRREGGIVVLASHGVTALDAATTLDLTPFAATRLADWSDAA
jgi:heme exporter protein A